MKKAVILLSGGLDSSTVLALAKRDGFEPYALTFDYGQRNAAEIHAAKQMAAHYGATEHNIVEFSLTAFKGSALTDETVAVPEVATQDIPSTYVPARNTIFLSFAMGWAESLGAHDIFIGASSVDYSGYPDCRPEYFEAFQSLANLATKTGVEGQAIRIHTPLLQLSKGETVKLGLSLGVDYSQTISCYQPDEQGRACGVCESCVLSKKGFEEAGIVDPTEYCGSR